MVANESLRPLIIQENKSPAGFELLLQQSLKNAVDQTGKHIPLHYIAVRVQVVDAQSLGTLAKRGVSGHTYSENKVRIRVANNTKDNKRILEKEAPRSLSHELHHAVRFKNIGYKHLLSDALVREGLATHFETEVWGGEPSPWATSLTQEQNLQMLQEALREIKANDENYDHGRWFYGSGDLPNWTGYTLGYHIVSEYLRLHPGDTAASLVSIPTENIMGEIQRLM